MLLKFKGFPKGDGCHSSPEDFWRTIKRLQTLQEVLHLLSALGSYPRPLENTVEPGHERASKVARAPCRYYLPIFQKSKALFFHPPATPSNSPRDR